MNEEVQQGETASGAQDSAEVVEQGSLDAGHVDEGAGLGAVEDGEDASSELLKHLQDAVAPLAEEVASVISRLQAIEENAGATNELHKSLMDHLDKVGERITVIESHLAARGEATANVAQEMVVHAPNAPEVIAALEARVKALETRTQHFV